VQARLRAERGGGARGQPARAGGDAAAGAARGVGAPRRGKAAAGARPPL